MDNTLIYTDRANNLAYEKAIKDSLPSNQGISLFNEIKSNNPKRITRKSLSEIAYLDNDTKNRIVMLKENCYECFLFSSLSNQENIDKKIDYTCKRNHLMPENVIKIMVTNCPKKRANALLKYHHLTTYFSQIIYCNGINNKFDFSLSYLEEFIKKQKISYQHIFIFDDDIHQIKNVHSNTIPMQNINLFAEE
ncbi:hypothetical protein [Histophilus somni]|uniref:hypothetical protein n=1 Tax=Histophilus somni TaxID=731 RepID=UPI00201E838E|nr:hypothetical protein [Histophilus somni]